MHNYKFITHTNLTRGARGAAHPSMPRSAPPPRDPPAPLAARVVPAAEAMLSRRALYLDVADRLREQIFSRRLEPGSWIDEQRLAVEYGISRTPLREALKVLAVEGLVTMKLRRGAYVTETSVDDVRQVYHLLALLESDAAAQVALHASPDERAELTRLHEALERQAGQREDFFATNERIHMRLLRIAGNRWAEQMVLDLRKVMKLNRHHSLFKQGRIAESLAEHRALMQAIADGDGERARALMRAHFDSGLEAAVTPAAA